MTRSGVHRFVRGVAIVCLVLAILPGMSGDGTPQSQRHNIRLGIPNSPWFQLVMETSDSEGRHLGSVNWRLYALTWSSAALLAGCVLFGVARRICPKLQ